MKFQLIGPAGMSVNQTPCSSVAIGQMPFSRTTHTPWAGVPSAWTIVPMTRVLPGVIVGPGVGNGVVPGSGVASAVASGGAPTAADSKGIGSAASDVALKGVGLADAADPTADEDGAGDAGTSVDAVQPQSTITQPIAIRRRFIRSMFAHPPEPPVARPRRT